MYILFICYNNITKNYFLINCKKTEKNKEKKEKIYTLKVYTYFYSFTISSYIKISFQN